MSSIYLPNSSVSTTFGSRSLLVQSPLEKIQKTYKNMKSAIEQYPDYPLNANFYSGEIIKTMQKFDETSKFQASIQSSTENFNESKIDSNTYLNEIEKVIVSFLNFANKKED